MGVVVAVEVVGVTVRMVVNVVVVMGLVVAVKVVGGVTVAMRI